jgi:general stress protein 26
MMMAICAAEVKSNFLVECAAGGPDKFGAFVGGVNAAEEMQNMKESSLWRDECTQWHQDEGAEPTLMRHR